MQKLRHIIDEPMRLKPVLIGVMSGSMPFSNHASHKVVRIEPKPETGYTETYAEFLSNHVAELTMKAMENWRHADVVDMFDKFLGTVAARGFAGKMFEQLIHRKFRDSYEFTPQGMTHPTHGQLLIRLGSVQIRSMINEDQSRNTKQRLRCVCKCVEKGL